MMDYYSSLSSPSIISEKCDIKNAYKRKYPTIDLYVSPENQTNILNELFQPHLNEQGSIKYSYTGYFAGNIRREIEYYYNGRMDILKKKHLRRKLRAVFKVVYVGLKWHKYSKERMYHPDSVFVKEILQSHFYSRC